MLFDAELICITPKIKSFFNPAKNEVKSARWD